MVKAKNEDKDLERNNNQEPGNRWFEGHPYHLPVPLLKI